MTTLLATIALVWTTSLPANAADLAGNWEALLAPSPAVELRLVLHVEKTPDGALAATLDSPDQSVLGTKVDRIEADGDAVSFEVAPLQAEFRGQRQGEALVGNWTQAGKSWPLSWTRQAAASPPAELWEGALKVGGGIELRLVVRATRRPDGTLRATLDSPDQGSLAIKVDAAALDPKTFSFQVKAIQGDFAGTLNPAGDVAVGTWTQLGRKMPLTLKKTTTVATINHPQTPRKPFPYREETVRFENPAAQIALAGTLTLPEGDGPFPAAVLISGSGPQDRDETLLGHKPFLVLADALTRRGIAVLRYDDRGVAESKGDFSRATSEDFASDAEAAFRWLKTHAKIDARRVGLIGHSEGGLIAPMVASKTPEVGFIVLLAGPGVPGEQILSRQGVLIARAIGASDAEIARQTALSRNVLEVIRGEPDEARAAAKIAKFVQAEIDALPEAERKALRDDPSAALIGQFASFRTPWFAFFLAFDPRPTLARVRCPVLALNGEKDLQVEPAQNLPEIAKALQAGGNTRVTIRELPGLNHLFQPCSTGSPAEYARIEQTIDPEVLRIVADWVLDQVKTP